jgi:ATP-dependent helicase/nuclease subunit B
MAKDNIYTIPAGISFVDALAQRLLEETKESPLSLTSYKILLPTRRACKHLQEAFLRQSAGKPLLLPAMAPLGDIDEEELSITLFQAEDMLSLPPSISKLERTILLTQLVRAQGRGKGLEQDVHLAQALGKLMDQIYTEDLDIQNLDKAVPREEFAEHWQVSLDFLKLISKHWPEILQERGVIDLADHRNRLMKKLASYWEAHPPEGKIIAAGSTGSIPATARFLKTIAELENGRVVLPGLDQLMDEESWNILDDTHPQYLLKQLLKKLEIPRDGVLLWPGIQEAEKHQARRRLVSEIMRPADTTDRWLDLPRNFTLSKDDISIERYDCDTSQEEALTIAVILREALENPDTTAAIVTPDRKLARRIAMACRRWGIEIDDSAGRSLPETEAGLFFQLCLEAACSGFRPVSLLAFCKTSLCLPPSFNNWRETVRKADEKIMRGPVSKKPLEYYKKQTGQEFFSASEKADLISFIEFIEDTFQELAALCNAEQPQPFEKWISSHLKVLECFCDPEILWSGEDGENLALFLSEIQEYAEDVPSLDGEAYLSFLVQMMKDISVRPVYGFHPRLAILGQLEARLLSADIMVLSGLNEETWPPAPPASPWMSRPMLKNFGLPSPERSIGLAAHDYAQALCGPKVYLTRSLKKDGAPTVPSRWLQRLDTVLEALNCKEEIYSGKALAIARKLDNVSNYTQIARPAPRPPLTLRPRKLSVTKIETWMNDPYSIYGRYILRLKKLDPLEQDLDAALRGNILHAVLFRFVSEGGALSVPRFLSLAREEFDKENIEGDVRALWEPRLYQLADWLVKKEAQWREVWKPYQQEISGEMVFETKEKPFTLTGKADRIDLSRDGESVAIIDYKSGGSFTMAGMLDGRHPQLPLEALMIENAAFENVRSLETGNLSYWILKGGKEPGIAVEVAGDKLQASIENAKEGFRRLIEIFDCEETPYYSIPNPDRIPAYNDYEYLARIKEWSLSNEAGDEA